MSETKNKNKNKNKRRLSSTLSLFSNNNSDQDFTYRKAPKIFEDPNGVVGLGIVAAMHDGGTQDPLFLKKRAAILAISPKSPNPVPVLLPTRNLVRKNLSFEEMEMSEEYTCVISHVGKNLVKKREYFDGDFLGVTEEVSEKFIFGTSVGGDGDGDWISSDLVNGYSFTAGQSFLNSCFLCKKQLHGLDIFMYRGETAFCSAECRYKQIYVDEHENCGSGVMKLADSFQCFAGVAAT